MLDCPFPSLSRQPAVARRRFEVLAATLALLACARPALAAWPGVTSNLAVCLMAGGQLYRTCISDGAGGMFVAWSDGRYVVTDIYAQHVRADGTLAWNANGLPVCLASGRQDQPVLAPDGMGGVYVAWRDYRNSPDGDIYGQRVSSTGLMQWTYNGISLCSKEGQQSVPVVATDETPDESGARGLYVAWQDERNEPRIYVQRFNGTGQTLWPDEAVVSTRLAAQFEPAMVLDGAAGTLLAWSQDGPGGFDVRAQRLAPDGAILWDSAGVAVGAASGDQFRPQIEGDGRGGAWVAWMDARAASLSVRVQHVRDEGGVTLEGNGLAVALATGDQSTPAMAADGAGGVFVAWNDTRTGSDIYAQRIDSLAGRVWPSGGVAVGTGSGLHTFPAIAADGPGSAVVVWEDSRSGATDIYAQRLNADGQAQWTVGGAGASLASGNQYQSAVVSSGDGTAIVMWSDTRAGNVDLYAQRVPVGTAAFQYAQAPRALSSSPNPARDETTLAFELPAAGTSELSIYDAAGRRVRHLTRAHFAMGDHRVTWDARDDAGRPCPGGIYFARILTEGHAVATRRIVLVR